MKKKYSRKKGPVRSKKVTFDGITFASGLEKYMYIALKKAKIKSEYEGHTFVLQEGFNFENESYERQSNGKGDMVNRGCKKIQPIRYTPDFIDMNEFIIEPKGRDNERFTNKWKMIKQFVKKKHKKEHLYTTQNTKKYNKIKE